MPAQLQIRPMLTPKLRTLTKTNLTSNTLKIDRQASHEVEDDEVDTEALSDDDDELAAADVSVSAPWSEATDRVARIEPFRRRFSDELPVSVLRLPIIVEFDRRTPEVPRLVVVAPFTCVRSNAVWAARQENRGEMEGRVNRQQSNNLFFATKKKKKKKKKKKNTDHRDKPHQRCRRQSRRRQPCC